MEVSATAKKVKQSLLIKRLKWDKPEFFELKLNIDGCSKGNPGQAGGGRVTRNHRRDMMMAFLDYF